eukprot:PhF_6_TR5158/c0_g1_i1/m.7382
MSNTSSPNPLFLGYIPNELQHYLIVDEIALCSTVCRSWRRFLYPAYRRRYEESLKGFLANPTTEKTLPRNARLRHVMKLFCSRAAECCVKLPPDPESSSNDSGYSTTEEIQFNWTSASETVRWQHKVVKRYRNEAIAVGFCTVQGKDEEVIIFAHSFGHSSMHPPVSFVFTMRSSSVTDQHPKGTWRLTPRDVTIEAHDGCEIFVGSVVRTMKEVFKAASPALENVPDPTTTKFMSTVDLFTPAPLLITSGPQVEFLKWCKASSSMKDFQNTLTQHVETITQSIHRYYDENSPMFYIRVLDREIVTHKGVASYTTNECEVTFAAKEVTLDRYVKKLTLAKSFVDRNAAGVFRSFTIVFPIGLLH